MRKLILTLVLCTLCLCPLFSQEAFYIYRNDGDFNGFFYDEVVEMRQSKIGVDSVEYDRWVTQEVVLADTIYRIPLAAIDSIGFQQPEIIINPDVRHMDLLGMTPYVTSRDGQTLTFSNDLPSSLMPQVGNVLFGMEGIFDEENFGGRVTSVRNESGGIKVETDKLTKMSDIFVQFITIEEVGFSEDDPTQLRRRMAGMNKIREWDGSHSINTINVNANLHIPINAGGTVGGSIDAGVYLKCRMVVLYQIHDEVYFIKCATHDEIGLQAGFTIQMEISNHEEVKPLIPKPFATIGYPAYPPFPLFELTPVPQLGYRYGGNITAKVSLPNVGYRMHQTFVFDSDLPELMTYKFSDEYVTPESEGIFDALTGMDAEVMLEGFFQIGGKEELALKTNSVFSSIIYASTGVDIWVGPKLDGSLNIDAKSFWTTDDGPYIFRDSHVGFSTLSLDMEAYSEIDNILMDEPIHKTWADGSIDLLPRLDLYAFPEFEEFNASHDESTHSVHAAWKAEPRCILWPCTPGIVMYRLVKGETDIVASGHDIAPKFGYTMKENYNVNFNTNNLKAGEYKVAPSLLVSGTDFPVRSMAKVITIPYMLHVSPDIVTIPANGGEVEFMISTNAPFDSQMDVNIGINTIDQHLDTLNANEGTYKFTCVMDTNRFIFGSSVLSDPGNNTMQTVVSVNGTSRPITVTQELMDLSRLEVFIDISKMIKIDNENWAGSEYHMVLRSSDLTATRINNHQIHISGSRQKTVDGENLVCSVDLTVQYVDTIPGVECYTPYELSGTIQCTGRSDHLNNTTYPINVNLTFDDKTGSELNVHNEHNTSTERTEYSITLYPIGYPYPGEE